jgi:hypothetical protein
MVSITKVTASPSSSFNSFNAPLMIAFSKLQMQQKKGHNAPFFMNKKNVNE